MKNWEYQRKFRMKWNQQQTDRKRHTCVPDMNWPTGGQTVPKFMGVWWKTLQKKKKKKSVSVFRIIPHNRFLWQLVPKAGKANDSRRCSHYRLHSPSELCAALGYITNKPYKLPDGHQLVILTEIEIIHTCRFLAPPVITLKIQTCLWQLQDKQTKLYAVSRL